MSEQWHEEVALGYTFEVIIQPHDCRMLDECATGAVHVYSLLLRVAVVMECAVHTYAASNNYAVADDLGG